MPKKVVEKFNFSEIKIENVKFFTQSTTKVFINIFIIGGCLASCLKVVSAAFLLVCFVCVKESTGMKQGKIILFHFESSFHS